MSGTTSGTRSQRIPAGRLACFLGTVCILLAGSVPAARAADYLSLPVVKPVMSCSRLAKAELGSFEGTRAGIRSTGVVDTPKGPYCKVTGWIEPETTFEADLPIEHWTQRYAQGAQGRGTIGNAGGCSPAVNGELAVATDNMGHTSKGGRSNTAWTSDLQLRIDWAYRANHLTALAVKRLIGIFYGRPPRFSYFVGCSEGGREALMEAQRYPGDFDGVAAGAPVTLDAIHNSFYHPWEAKANRLVAGSRILKSSMLGLLHKAVIEHCAGPSDAIDGMLQEPTACKFDPAWVQCPAGSTAAADCLTAQEVAVVEKLYAGASDAAGHRFLIAGWPLGSELFWKLSTAHHFGDRETDEGFALKRLLPPPESDASQETLYREFSYDQQWFDKMLVLAPMYDAANTDLRPFEQHGGKLILWQGAEDLTVQPADTIAYYEGVRQKLGASSTNAFMRFFLLPGVGHCGGGEGPAQIDVLSPLMRWVELHRAPTVIVAGKTAGRRRRGWSYPFSPPDRPTQYTLPVYPFPYVARYSGQGDPKDARNYHAVKSSIPVPQKFSGEVMRLIGPDNQKFYRVVDGRLTASQQPRT